MSLSWTATKWTGSAPIGQLGAAMAALEVTDAAAEKALQEVLAGTRTQPTTSGAAASRKRREVGGPGPRPRGDARRQNGRGARRARAGGRRRGPARGAALLRPRGLRPFAAALAGGAIPDASVESVVAAMVHARTARLLQVQLALPAPAVARDACDERRAARGVPADWRSLPDARSSAARSRGAPRPRPRTRPGRASSARSPDAARRVRRVPQVHRGPRPGAAGRRRQGGDGSRRG